jgi:hypothetical protein
MPSSGKAQPLEGVRLYLVSTGRHVVLDVLAVDRLDFHVGGIGPFRTGELTLELLPQRRFHPRRERHVGPGDQQCRCGCCGRSTTACGGRLEGFLARTHDERASNTRSSSRQSASEVARAGIEPATFRFSGGRSYQLSYLAERHRPYRSPNASPIVATLTGLEPATSAVTGRRANQLRHRALLCAASYRTVPRVPPTGFEPALPP